MTFIELVSSLDALATLGMSAAVLLTSWVEPKGLATPPLVNAEGPAYVEIKSSFDE